MNTKSKNVAVEVISNDEIEQLRKTIRSTWITSVQAIYAFGKAHSRASIATSLKDLGLTLTKKANAFTGAAKLALTEKVDGKWVICDAQVSRYTRVCKYLNSLKVDPDDVEKALAGKTMTELVQAKPKKDLDPKDFENAVKNVETFYAASKLFSFGDDKLPVSEEAGLIPGINMAAVVCDPAGNITAICGLAGEDDAYFRKLIVSKCKDEATEEVNENEDHVGNTVAEAA